MTLPSWFSGKIGRCPRCMGLSLGLMLLAWTLAAATLLLELPPVLTLSLGCAGLAFTALFLAHVVAFTLRAARAEVTPCPHCGAGAELEAGDLSRRRLIGIAGQAVVAATVLSFLNMPGVKRVFAQDPFPCEDIGGPIEFIPKVCVTAATEEQVKQQLAQQAQAWITANEGTFEATAKSNCQDKGCTGADAGKRCVAVDWRVSYRVTCRDDLECETRRSCEAVVSMGVACRCVPRECSTTKFTKPVDLFAEVCTQNADPTKKEIDEACKAAGKKLEALVAAAAARTCAEETCPPRNNKTPKCEPGKVTTTKVVVERVPDRKNCCRVSTTITAVQCKCG